MTQPFLRLYSVSRMLKVWPSRLYYLSTVWGVSLVWLPFCLSTVILLYLHVTWNSALIGTSTCLQILDFQVKNCCEVIITALLKLESFCLVILRTGKKIKLALQNQICLCRCKCECDVELCAPLFTLQFCLHWMVSQSTIRTKMLSFSLNQNSAYSVECSWFRNLHCKCSLQWIFTVKINICCLITSLFYGLFLFLLLAWRNVCFVFILEIWMCQIWRRMDWNGSLVDTCY